MKEIKNQRKRFFIVDGDTVTPVDESLYESAPLYVAEDSFEVERRLSKPDEGQSVVYEGKKPKGKTTPIVILHDGSMRKADSWEALEGNPALLMQAKEVVAALPVKQVFVLKRKLEAAA